MNFILWLSIYVLISTTFAYLNVNLQPKQLIASETFGRSFRGNDKNKSDRFKLLVKDEEYLLVGARNAVYNLSIDTLSVQKVLEWPSIPSDVDLCLKKSKSEEECHNYIRVLVKQNDGLILLCGTNAFQPNCRQYSINEDSSWQSVREFSGFAISPFDPHHNSTYVYVAENDELYTGSVSDFAGSDSLIYRKQLSSTSGTTSQMRTVKNDLNCLNDPSFVSSFSDDTNVYFWFRETAVESTEDNRRIYSRVGRVCKKDQGGLHMSKSRQTFGLWTTFVKARLNCSLAGSTPFYFDELRATTDVIFGHYDGTDASLVYAAFSTSYEGIQASAICAFNLADVRRIFDQGAFKVQPDSNSLWMPLSKPLSAARRPGNCDSNQTDDMVNFIQKNSLMYDAVPNFFSKPLYVGTNLKSHFTQIVAHKARSVDDALYDMLFLGTSDGRLLKIVNVGQRTSIDAGAVLISVIRLFSVTTPVLNLLISTRDDSVAMEKSNKSGKIIAVSHDEIKSVPLHFCSERQTCSSCVRLRDPYCAWDTVNSLCIGVTNGVWPEDRKFIQNIRTGQTFDCPLGEYEPELYNTDDIYSLSSKPVATPITVSSQHRHFHLYTAQSLTLAIILAVLCSVVVGFIVGYRLASIKRRKCLTRQPNNQHDREKFEKFVVSRGQRRDVVTYGRNMEDYGHPLQKATDYVYGDTTPPIPSDDYYEAPPSYKTRGPSSSHYSSSNSNGLNHMNQQQISPPKLLTKKSCGGFSSLNNNQFSATLQQPAQHSHKLNVDKNLLPPMLNNGTLPKDYKVKKVYL